MALKTGEIVKGIITGITNFGAFIKLEDGSTGLCHISEVSDEYVKDINNHLKVGDEVKVKILKIKEDNKLELSIKEANKKKEEKKERSFQHGKKQSFETMLSDFLKDSDERQKGIKQRDQKY